MSVNTPRSDVAEEQKELFSGDVPVTPPPFTPENIDPNTPRTPDVREGDNIVVAPPAASIREEDNTVAILPAPQTLEGDSIVVAAPLSYTSHLQVSPIDSRWSGGDSEDSDQSDEIDDDSENSDSTVSGWELDEEFEGDGGDDDDEDIPIIAPAPHSLENRANLNMTASMFTDPEDSMFFSRAAFHGPDGVNDQQEFTMFPPHNPEEANDMEFNAWVLPAPEAVPGLNVAASAPHDPQHANGLDVDAQAALAPGMVNELHIPALAPYAPKNTGKFSESDGEILTQQSWKKVLAGIPPGMPLQDDPEPMVEPAVDPDDDNVAQQSEAEDDIYNATPPPVAVEDRHDSDYDYGEAEAQSDPEPNDLDDGEDDGSLARIPLPKDDSDDEDFVLRKNKRKAPASARKHVKKSNARAKGGCGATQSPVHQRSLVPEPNVPGASFQGGQDASANRGLSTAKASMRAQSTLSDLDDEDDEEPLPAGINRRTYKQRANRVATASGTPGPASPLLAGPFNSGPARKVNAEEDSTPGSLAARARELQKTISGLREEVMSAEALYEEAANNPRVAKDPRTKKRRAGKLEELRVKLRHAVEEHAQFAEQHGDGLFADAGGHLNHGAVNTSTNPAASFSTGAAATAMPSRLQVLQQEVSSWQDTIHELRRRVRHCEVQVAAVEANPDKYSDKRIGFLQGRKTRLHNAQHSLNHNMQMLVDKQRLYNEEYTRVHGLAVSQSQNGQQEEETFKKPKSAAHDPAQSSALQRSTSHKRKASAMEEEEEEEEEEVLPASSKRRRGQGTPAL